MSPSPNHPTYPQFLSSCAPHQKASHQKAHGVAKYPAVVASLPQLRERKPCFPELPINQGWVAQYPRPVSGTGSHLEVGRWESHIQCKPMVRPKQRIFQQPGPPPPNCRIPPADNSVTHASMSTIMHIPNHLPNLVKAHSIHGISTIHSNWTLLPNALSPLTAPS